MKYFYLFLLPLLLEAASIRLQNDASYPLSATVIGADGSILGDTLLSPQETITWSDADPFRTDPNRPSKSQSPYTVIFRCEEESLYSTVDGVSTGSLVKASQGSGSKSCKKKSGEKK